MLALTQDEVALIGSLLDFDLLETLMTAIRCDSRYRAVYHTLTQVPVELVVLGAQNLPTREVMARHRLKIKLGSVGWLVREFLIANAGHIAAYDLHLPDFRASPEMQVKVTRLTTDVYADLDLSPFVNLEHLALRYRDWNAPLPSLNLPRLRAVEMEQDAWVRGYVPVELSPSVEVFRFKGIIGPHFVNPDFPLLKLFEFRKTNIPPEFHESTTQNSFPRLRTLECASLSFDVGSLLALMGSNLVKLAHRGHEVEYPASIQHLKCNAVWAQKHTPFPPKLLSLDTTWFRVLPDTLRVLRIDFEVPENFRLPPQVHDFCLEGFFPRSMLDSCSNLLALTLRSKQRYPLWLQYVGEDVDFANMPSLRRLTIAGYRIGSITIAPPVEELCFESCCLESVQVPRLVVKLDLYDSNLTQLPVDNTYINLKELQISKNNWKDRLVVDIPNLVKLTIGNQDLDALILPPSLKHVDWDSARVVTQGIIGQPVEPNVVCLLPNEMVLTTENQVYKYHPSTTELQLSVNAGWHPSAFSFPPLHYAYMIFADEVSPEDMSTIFDGCTIRFLDLSIRNWPTRSQPLAIPALVETLKIEVWNFQGSGVVHLTFHGQPRLRELEVKIGIRDMWAEYAFVDGLPETLECVNGTPL